MDDLEVHHELGIFVFERVIAMRRRNDNSFDAAVDKCLDVFLGQAFEHVFAACFADTFTTTVFLFTQYSEIDPGLVENGGCGSGNFFHSGVKAQVAADKIQYLHFLGERFHRQIFCPIRAFLPFKLQGFPSEIRLARAVRAGRTDAGKTS